MCIDLGIQCFEWTVGLIDLSGCSNGIYVIKIADNEGHSNQMRYIKN